jgi:sugar lactone lactonase YvrE
MNRRQLLTMMAVGLSSYGKSLREQPTIQEWQDAKRVAIDGPEGLAMDSSSNLYIAEAFGPRVLVLNTKTGKIRTVVGGGNAPIMPGATAGSVKLGWPRSLAVDKNENLWIADRVAGVVIQVNTRTERVSQVVGGAKGDPSRTFVEPSGIVISSTGEIYVLDWVTGPNPPRSRDHGVFRITPETGEFTRITGSRGPIQIIPNLLFPRGLAVTPSGLMYIADKDNNRIIEASLVTKQTRVIINTQEPKSLTLNNSGVLYFTDAMPWVRSFDSSNGRIRTVTGGQIRQFSGDDGPAISATMVAPFGLAVDQTGNLFVSDSYDNRIRRIDARSNVITTVAGNGAPVRPVIGTVPLK